MAPPRLSVVPLESFKGDLQDEMQLQRFRQLKREVDVKSEELRRQLGRPPRKSEYSDLLRAARCEARALREALWPAGGLHKVPGLQGPIDDAFMSRFCFVRPQATESMGAAEQWAEFEMEHAIHRWEAVRMWHRLCLLRA